MSEPFEPDVEEDEDVTAESSDDQDRAPQPGNTPAPDEPPAQGGAILGRDDES